MKLIHTQKLTNNNMRFNDVYNYYEVDIPKEILLFNVNEIKFKFDKNKISYALWRNTVEGNKILFISFDSDIIEWYY